MFVEYNMFKIKPTMILTTKSEKRRNYEEWKYKKLLKGCNISKFCLR